MTTKRLLAVGVIRARVCLCWLCWWLLLSSVAVEAAAAWSLSSSSSSSSSCGRWWRWPLSSKSTRLPLSSSSIQQQQQRHIQLQLPQRERADSTVPTSWSLLLPLSRSNRTNQAAVSATTATAFEYNDHYDDDDDHDAGPMVATTSISSSSSSSISSSSNILPLLCSDLGRRFTMMRPAARTVLPSWRRTTFRVPRQWRTLAWIWPLGLCLVPVVTQLGWQCHPSTPSWWKLVNLWALLDPVNVVGGVGAGAVAGVTMASAAPWLGPLLGGFLWSNVAFFGAGLYLLYHYHPFLTTKTTTTTPIPTTTKEQQQQSSGTTGRLAMMIMLPLPLPLRVPDWRPISTCFSLSDRSTSTPTTAKTIPPTSWLGLWVLLAGLVSTLFHTVQTWGDYAVAEGWCFVDHGVALAALTYFRHVLGWPRTMRTGIVAILAGLALVAPPAGFVPLVVHTVVRLGYLPRAAAPAGAYAVLHALWHVLAAWTAVWWALDGPVPHNEGTSGNGMEHPYTVPPLL